ncbi:MAG: ATP synthase F1 subunit gamma [Erysipelotrichia bacterium]|nr:ATP synthase F1 subunit gamma [Erysipelotrichia bacterium]
MASKLEIKNRIRSVDSTKKITKAMQLVAASKLKKCKDRMEENKEYAKYLKETVDSILADLSDCSHPYLLSDETKPALTIIFSSDMGLCGGYNANEFRLIESQIDKESPIIVLGSRGNAYLARRKYNVIKTLVNVDEEGYEDIVEVANLALEMYAKQEVSGIQIVYTQYVNPVTFEPKLTHLLPVEKLTQTSTMTQTTIFEPSGEEILYDLVPMFLKSLLYSYWLETKTSEQGSRQNAMESATDNAQELRDGLELQYNQARQAAITQEITEIVGGANAL